MSMTQIESVTQKTLPRFFELAKEMYLESTSNDLEFSEDLLVKLIEKPETFCVLAKSSDEYVGGMLGFVSRHYFSKDIKAVESGFYVKPAFRNGMIGVRLIRSFEKWAKEKNAKHVWLGYSCGIGNIDRMKDYYKALGYNYEGFFCRKKLNV